MLYQWAVFHPEALLRTGRASCAYYYSPPPPGSISKDSATGSFEIEPGGNSVGNIPPGCAKGGLEHSLRLFSLTEKPVACNWRRKEIKPSLLGLS